jgi:sugar-phosphatase
MNTIECDAILFDLDGVLIDSLACIERHWQQWATRHGLDMAEVMRVAHGRKTDETIRLVAPQLDAAEEARQLEASEANDTRGVLRVEGALTLLNSLPADSWAIATSGTRPVALTRLKHSGLPLPRVLVTADDVVRGKPDPEPYLMAARRLGIPPERCPD